MVSLLLKLQYWLRACSDVDNDLKQALGGGRTEEDLADSAADQAYYLIRM